MHGYKSLALLALCCSAAVQAGTLSRNGGLESKDSVEVTDKGISVKSGYEGYVLPTSAIVAEDRKDSSGWLSTSRLDVMKAIIMYKSSFLPTIGLKIARVLMHFALALFVGIASTTAVCSFTPLCKISFEGSKPALLSDEKDILPQLRDALEVVSRIPNFLKGDQTPAQEQPDQPTIAADSAVEESAEQIVDPRNPQKNSDEEGRNLKSADAKENEA